MAVDRFHLTQLMQKPLELRSIPVDNIIKKKQNCHLNLFKPYQRAKQYQIFFVFVLTF